jgi:Domain of unknown function (DUF4389)
VSSVERPPDDGRDDEDFEQDKIEDHLRSKSTWMRLVFMLICVALWAISRIVVGAVVVLQFLWVLVTGITNPRLTKLGQDLATYTYQIVLYLTFNTQRRPFPFNEWPDGPPRD